MAEERASEIEAQKRRLELDLAEASSSLERLSKEASVADEPRASLTLADETGASLALKDKATMSRKQKTECKAKGNAEAQEGLRLTCI